MSVEKQHRMNPDSDLFHILGNPSNLLLDKGQEQTPGSGSLAIRRLAALVILIVGAVFPAWIAGVLAQTPRTRDIHIATVSVPRASRPIAGIACGLLFRPAIPARVSSSRITIFTSPSLPATSWCRFSGSHTLTIPRR
jgi:hypothetical protein